VAGLTEAEREQIRARFRASASAERTPSPERLTRLAALLAAGAIRRARTAARKKPAHTAECLALVNRSSAQCICEGRPR
jgi:hypothetical protein